jgi:hypothetical protein
MPTKRFSLERGGPKRLEVSWKMFWGDIRIRLDGTEIGSIQNQKELTEGRDFTLPDGSKLNVKLSRRILTLDIQLLRDGKPVPGSTSDPAQVLKSSYGPIFFIGGLNILLGFWALLDENMFLHKYIADGVFNIFYGCVFLILVLFVKNRSAIALGIAIVIFAIDSLLSLSTVSSTIVTVMMARIGFLLLMAQGFGAIRELKKEDKK